MAAPEYVPVAPQDRPRRAEQLPPARHWMADRPGDFAQRRRQPVGPRLGRPGPDLGYVLTLVPRFDDRLVLGEGEHRGDADAGCVAVAMRRASLFGRAPVIYDLEFAYSLFGFLRPDPPADLVAERRRRFAGAAHHYWDQREIADRVPDATLRLAPAEVDARLSDWRSLLAG